MTKKFNPLADDVLPIPKIRQSIDLAPDPEPAKEFDTTTPAVAPRDPRRFTLGDLPRYADALYPKLQYLFPHVNERMYGGWLRGCINDNSCLFLCIDAQNGAPGALGMAFIAHEPLTPVPYVDLLVIVGAEDVRLAMYKKMIQWGREVGAHEVRVRLQTEDETLKKIDGVDYEERMTVVLHLG